MCNLYRLNPDQKIFDLGGANVPAEIYPNYPGIVVESGTAHTMNWGFPVRLKNMKPTSKPRPVNNARDDKLRISHLWRDSFEHRRCLIPVSQWAEAQGTPGAMTKTWYGLPGAAAFMVAGLWRPTDEWGDCYTMVMTDSSPQMAEVHDRMPVILRTEDCDLWTQGTPEAAFELVRTWTGPLAVDATDERWRG